MVNAFFVMGYSEARPADNHTDNIKTVSIYPLPIPGDIARAAAPERWRLVKLTLSSGAATESSSRERTLLKKTTVSLLRTMISTSKRSGAGYDGDFITTFFAGGRRQGPPHPATPVVSCEKYMMVNSRALCVRAHITLAGEQTDFLECAVLVGAYAIHAA